jgi:hypothetical protein
MAKLRENVGHEDYCLLGCDIMQSGSGEHPASCTVGTKSYFHRGKVVGVNNGIALPPFPHTSSWQCV